LKTAGAAGDITVEARQVILKEGAKIVSNTYGAGHGGTIHLHASESLTISGYGPIKPSSSGVYAGSLNSDELYGDGMGLKDGLLAGQAGEIFIQAATFNLLKGSRISTQQTRNTGGGGGNLTLSTTNLFYLQGQLITSVKGGKGNSGNITIEQPQFVVLNQAQIKAQADAGQGGNIRIVAQQFVPSVESLVSASSNLGIDGQISIESPTEDIGSQVLNLSANYLNAASLFPRSCAARIADQRPSQFVRPFTLIVRPKTMIAAPEDTRASPYPVTMHYKWFDQYR